MANDCLKIPAFNSMAIDAHLGINCPQFYFEIGKEPFKHILGDVVDVTNFDVNLLHLRPGQGSSQGLRHAIP